MTEPILKIRHLTVTTGENIETKVILDDISLDVPSLSITALVGGSGSGKTTTGLAVLRLLSHGLKLSAGSVIFDGMNLIELSMEKMRQIRGAGISMVFQEPLNAFNPVFPIGYQIDEVLRAHSNMDKAQRQKKVLELLDVVGLPEPRRTAMNYPHQLSGGMRQRAMIAQAIAVNPKLIIADEPTSNLDVTLQARIIELFNKLKREFNLSVLLITHDLGMVAHMADRVAVMTHGRIVEHGETSQILKNPQHLYTQELMEALL